MCVYVCVCVCVCVSTDLGDGESGDRGGVEGLEGVDAPESRQQLLPARHHDALTRQQHTHSINNKNKNECTASAL